MYTIEKISNPALKVLQKLVDSDVATVSYDAKRKEFHIFLIENNAYALCIAEEDDDNENNHIRFSIEIHSEAGFYNFFKIFPSIRPIDYEENQNIVNNLRFLNAFISGEDFTKSVSTIDDYKFYFRYDGSNYRFISEIGIDDPRFNDSDKNHVSFVYDYYFNYSLECIDVEKSLEIKGLRSISKPYYTDNIKAEVKDIFHEILAESAKKIDKNIDEITLKDHLILNMAYI